MASRTPQPDSATMWINSHRLVTFRWPVHALQAALDVIGQLQRQVDDHEAQYGDELLAASERIKVHTHIIVPQHEPVDDRHILGYPILLWSCVASCAAWHVGVHQAAQTSS